MRIKLLLIILAGVVICFSSCSKKESDFKGHYSFYVASPYYILDSTTLTGKWINKFNQIQTTRLERVDIEVYEMQDKIGGTMTLNRLQKESGGYYFDAPNALKWELNNFRMNGDTLNFITKLNVPFVGERIQDFKLIKNSNEVILVYPKDGGTGALEDCNKFVKSNSGSEIFYISISEDSKKAIAESNECADAKALKEAEAIYPKEKLQMVKEMLSKH